jgi:hypothetical protein
MSSTKSKLRLVCAFAALATLALAVGCRGFFVNPTLNAISIQPPTPNIPLDGTLAIQAWGTYSDTSRTQIKTGVQWTVTNSTGSATIDENTGIASGTSIGAITITAAAQGLSATATGTVYLTGVTSITVTPQSNTVSTSAGGTASYTATANATVNGVNITQDITSGATWTLVPSSTSITCTGGVSPFTCNVPSGSLATEGTYTLTVTYPGTTVTGTANLVIGP